jgi:hydroxyacylglutathione hydrolase
MLYVQTFVFNSLAENTYIIYDETKACAIIDPGCYTPNEREVLVEFIKQHQLQVSHLVNTHCHIDHILGNQYIKEQYEVKLTIHPQEITNLQLAPTYAPQYGFIAYQPTKPDIFVQAGDIIHLGNSDLEVLHLPGHAPGHIALYNKQNGICLVGDVLFKGYIGRTDLPGGNYSSLLESIHHQLFLLEDRTTLYPGHGPTTTLGQEKASNPFCKIVRA